MAKSLGWYLPEQLILKITLIDSDPKIWRRVEVHSGLTLYELHYVIQSVFDWDDAHLYHFMVSPDGKQTQKAMRDAIRYHTLPPDPIFDDDLDDGKSARADEAMIGRIFSDACKQILYEYDFGDSWQHLVVLEKRTQGGDQETPPACLAGENAAPADDMGGIGGYYLWLDALRDEDNDMHEEAIEWLGEDFDPTKFDLETANKRLAATFKPVKKKPRKKKP